MKELFDVSFHPNGDGFEMKMVNGSLDVPDEKGCYVLSTGCGSGKTECCKSIIRQKAEEGILYCVDTIAELDKMYQWIAQHGTEFGVSANDVIIISSDERHKYSLHQYHNSPDILMSKKVVLITHVRFWTDLINYFLIYKPQTPVEAFDCNFEKLMGRGDLRKYVIFDETPTFIQPFFSMPMSVLASFCHRESMNRLRCYTSGEIKETYNQFFRNRSTSPFPKSNTVISEIKRNVIFQLIPEYFDQWINSTDEDAEISFTPLHLSQQKVNTHILVLEGAGNVLFEGSQFYKLIDVKQKYNCCVRFTSFPFLLKRRNDRINVNAFSDFLDWCHNHLLENQMKGKKTLLVVWMNYGKDSAQSKNTDYYDKVAKLLSEYKELNKDMYRVIYYGSSDSKSTNDFRDFNEIILAGKWSIPNTDTQKFKMSFGVDVDNKRHRLWAFIQLLCRIGIRLHDGKEYSVCYSSDFSDDFICNIKDYMENKDLPPIPTQESDIPDWLEERFERAKIRANFRTDIWTLCKWNNLILEALQRGENYNPRVSLDELFSIIPKDRKKQERYRSLLQALRKLGIKIKIT